MTEGKKTVSFEIYEQLGKKAPDVVMVSVGNGSIIGGVYKGFKDLHALGWIDKMPRIIGVQAKGSNYMAEAWKNRENVLAKPAIQTSTIADSISTGFPRDRLKAMRAVRATGGAFVTVEDEQILEAIPMLATQTGVFAEPAGAITFAGLLQLLKQQELDSNENVVLINTGHGLKDIPAANKALTLINQEATMIAPTIDSMVEEISQSAITDNMTVVL